MMMRTNCKIINEIRSFGDVMFSRAQGCEGNSKGMPNPHRMLDTMFLFTQSGAKTIVLGYV
jgi:hypothetical protein